MHSILISFQFPAILGTFTWIEGGITLLVVGLVFLWRKRKASFSPTGFLVGVVVYAVIRALVWVAGPGYHFQLHTYGVLIALGFVAGIVVAVRQARKEFIDPNVVLDLAFWILVSAMVGSRLLYILVNLHEYVADPLALVKVWTGGLVFYGGFLGAVAASWYYCRKKGLSFFRISDLMIPSVALGHFFGRMGCWSAGCCHGCATGSEHFGAVFTAAGTVVARSRLLGVPIHPTQLYEAFGELSIFLALILLRKRKRFNGQLLCIWLVAYPVWRFCTELFRGDLERGMLFRVDLFGDPTPEILSTSQVVSIGLIGLGIFLWVVLSRSAKTGKADSLDQVGEGKEPQAPSPLSSS
jgi:phosphatidylglycerol---prolipoprotein diacylglyceryl transferase